MNNYLDKLAGPLDFWYPQIVATWPPAARRSASGSDKQLAVIGGGFASVALLCNLISKWMKENPGPGVLTIFHIEKDPSRALGGIAYGDYTHFDHKLNLQGERIGVFPGGCEPKGVEPFSMFVRNHLNGAAAYLNGPFRKLFSRYTTRVLSDLLEQAQASIRYVPVHGKVINIEENDQGCRCVELERGDGLGNRSFFVDRIVLATGFEGAVRLPVFGGMPNDKRYLEGPYGPRAEIFFDAVRQSAKRSGWHWLGKRARRAFVAGTGLEAYDAVLRLADAGFDGEIVMLSRHGARHDGYTSKPLEAFITASIESTGRTNMREPIGMQLLPASQRPTFLAEPSLSMMVNKMKMEFTALLRAGYASEAILSHWERFVPEVVEKFPGRKTIIARFLRDYESVIRARRVGVVPDIHEKIETMVRSGKLRIITGTINDTFAHKKGIEISYTIKGGKRETTERFDYVLSAVGNKTAFNAAAVVQDPLWSNLLAAGKAMPHWTGKGVALSSEQRLICADGTVSSGIYATGIPAAGHMTVTTYPYPEKEGTGGRLGPFSLNIPAIVGQADRIAGDLVRDLTVKPIRLTPSPPPPLWRRSPRAVSSTART